MSLAHQIPPPEPVAGLYETGLPDCAFPPDCPYSVAQLLDDDYWPGAE